MEFTYSAYVNLIRKLKEKGYKFCAYDDDYSNGKNVIFRHDIDASIERALNLARIEHDEKIMSTFFVLITSPLYNTISTIEIERLKEIAALGHEVGLHYDEKYYNPLDEDELKSSLYFEANLLSEILGKKVKSVSMHIPSIETLESDYSFDGIVNSYSKKYFKEFKYLSDSRHCWREKVLDIIESEEFDNLHILTHPIWYHDSELSISETISEFSSYKRDEIKLIFENDLL